MYVREFSERLIKTILLMLQDFSNVHIVLSEFSNYSIRLSLLIQKENNLNIFCRYYVLYGTDILSLTSDKH